MKAVIVTGGKQYTVAEGDILFVEKLNAGNNNCLHFLFHLLHFVDSLGGRMPCRHDF